MFLNRVRLNSHSMQTVRNFRNLNIGDSASVTKRICEEDIKKFSELCGDTNPIHFSKERALVHGAYLNSLVSGVIGTKLPGPGTVLISQTLNFPDKCYVGETVTVSVELTGNRKIKTIHYECKVEDRDVTKVVMFGDAKVILST